MANVFSSGSTLIMEANADLHQLQYTPLIP
jgi:hypothetical protein